MSIPNLPQGPLNQHKIRQIEKMVRNGSITKLTSIAHREGLGLRVYPISEKNPNGMITFQGRYRLNGAQQRCDYGHYPNLTLREAEDEHRAVKAKLESGIDPKISEDECTLNELVADFIQERILVDRKDPQQAIRMLKNELPSKLLRCDVNDITQRQISDLLLSIVKRGAPVSANRLMALVKQLFNYGIERGYLENNPAERITRRSVGGNEKARERNLSFEELQAVLKSLPLRDIDEEPAENAVDIHEITKLAIWFLITTGQRTGEVQSMIWDEIDEELLIWTIPGNKTKNGKTHKVPLTDLALHVLGLAKKWGQGEELCFPSSRDSSKQMDSKSIARAVKRHHSEIGVESFTPHDLRRTFVSRMADLGVAPHVIEKCINHSLGGVLAVYNRGEYWSERCSAFQAWSNSCLTSIS